MSIYGTPLQAPLLRGAFGDTDSYVFGISFHIVATDKNLSGLFGVSFSNIAYTTAVK